MRHLPHDALCRVLLACDVEPRPWRLALRLVSTAWCAAFRTASTVPLMAEAEAGRADVDVWWPGPLCQEWAERAARAIFGDGGDLARLVRWACDEVGLCSTMSALLLATSAGRADVVRELLLRPDANETDTWLRRAVITAAGGGHIDVLDALANDADGLCDLMQTAVNCVRTLAQTAVDRAVCGFHAGALDRLWRPPYWDATTEKQPFSIYTWDNLVTAIERASADEEDRVVAVLDRVAPFTDSLHSEARRALLYATAMQEMVRVIERFAAPPYNFGADDAAWCSDFADELPHAVRESMSRAPFFVPHQPAAPATATHVTDQTFV